MFPTHFEPVLRYDEDMKALLYCAAYKKDFATPGYGVAKWDTPILGKPLLKWQTESLLHNGVDHLFIAWPKKADVPDFLAGNAQVSLLLLDKPKGNAGAIASLAELDEDLLYVPGDLFLDVDLHRFLKFHKEKGAMISAFVHPEPHPEQKDVLIVKPNGRGFVVLPKETSAARDFAYRNIIPTDLAIVSGDFLSTYDPDDICPLNFRDDVFAPTLAIEGLYAYHSSEYIVKMEDRLSIEKVTNDVSKGIPERKNLKNPQTAFFLDRDGTLNVFGDFVVKAEMLHLIPGAAKAVKKINDSGYLAVCITNQPIVARGETTMGELQRIMATLEMELGKEGAYLDGIYFCPHFPIKKEQSVAEYTRECDCRKPKIGMLLKAKKDHNINFESSWFIGDTTQDVQTAKNAETHSVLLLGGDPHPYAKYPDAKPDFIVGNLAEAVEKIDILR